MTDVVGPVLLRLEGLERVQEVGDAEALVRPALEVAYRCGEVLGVVGERGGEGADPGDDARDVGVRVVVGRGIRNRPVLDLQGLERGRRRLELQPRVARLGQAGVLYDLGFADDDLRGAGVDGHVNLRSASQDDLGSILRDSFLSNSPSPGRVPVAAKAR